MESRTAVADHRRATVPALEMNHMQTLLRLAAILSAGLCLPALPAPADEPADNFARWEGAIAAFERADRQEPPPKGAVLFVGSSSIRLWDLPKSFPHLTVINRGFGGSHLADAVHFADRLILRHEPRTVVVYAGDNDLAAGKSPERVGKDFRALVRTVRHELPRTGIVYVAIKPSLKRWQLAEQVRAANSLIRQICESDERLAFVDVFDPMLGDDGMPRPELFVKDGLHLSKKGYALWARLLRPHLTSPASEGDETNGTNGH